MLVYRFEWNFFFYFFFHFYFYFYLALRCHLIYSPHLMEGKEKRRAAIRNAGSRPALHCRLNCGRLQEQQQLQRWSWWPSHLASPLSTCPVHLFALFRSLFPSFSIFACCLLLSIHSLMHSFIHSFPVFLYLCSGHYMEIFCILISSKTTPVFVPFCCFTRKL